MMAESKPETGLLGGVLPYVRTGSGARELIVIPGLSDALQPVDAAPRFWARFAKPYTAGRTVYVVGRQRGLVPATSTRDMAAQYAEVLREFVGEADVLGASMGGFIAEYLAADHADAVRRLVLANTGVRPAAEKLPLYRMWREWTVQGRWRDAFIDMMERMYDTGLVGSYGDWLRASPKSIVRQEIDPADFIVSIDACLSHDASDVVGSIRQPTLVLGGTHDRLMPAAASEDLAARTCGARLSLIEGAGHGMFEENRGECARVILAFLD